MAQTKPKAAQFYGVSNNGTAGQVLISDGNGGMSWGANTEQFTVSWATPTGQSLTYTQPNPQSSAGTPGVSFPTTTFTVTKSSAILSGTATIANLPTGITATQVITGSGVGNTLTVTLAGVFPSADSLNTALIISGLTVSKTVSWATPTGQSLTYTQPSPQSSIGNSGTAFPTTTFTATKSGEVISGTATIAGLPTGITASQSISGSGSGNVLTITLAGVFPGADSLNTALTISGLTVAAPLVVSYLSIAGGGSGGGNEGGGGGAGGLRTSYPGSTTGGGGSAENTLTLVVATNYLVTIGAGGTMATPSGSGPAPYGYAPGGDGSNSVFASITSTGGGGGGTGISAQSPPFEPGRTGGSGGGGSRGGNAVIAGGAAASPTQGYAGGASALNQGDSTGGGGGAGAVGVSATTAGGFDGGVGLQNSITNTTTYYAGGGGGGGYSGSPSVGSGGNGGGGDGLQLGPPATANAGAANTGGGAGGGGGSGADNQRGGAPGGSGIVIIRYPNSYTITVPAGLTATTDSSISGVRVTKLTAGTGNIQFN